MRELTEGEDFFQQEDETNIPSQVSVLTATTEYGEERSGTKSVDANQRGGRISSIMHPRKSRDNRAISGDFTVNTFAEIQSRFSVDTCEDIFLIKLLLNKIKY